MNLPTIEYWFRPCDDAASPSTEWRRQVGVAIAAASGALVGREENVLEIYTGTVNGHPAMRQKRLVSAEVVSFRGSCSGLVEEALRGVGSSRQVAVTKDDVVSRARLAQFGFLLGGYLVRPFWWGADNERDLEAQTGIPVVCSTGEDDDAFLRACFGAPDAAKRLQPFLRAKIARKLV